MIVTDLSTSFHPCPKQKNKTEKVDRKSGQMRQKSKKLEKLENSRFSIITKDLERCYVCKAKKQDLHEIFGGRNRQASMKYGLVIPVCRKCHSLIENDKTLKQKWHEVGQKEFNKHYKTENFVQIFRKNYL